MNNLFPKLAVLLSIILVAFIINFKFETEADIKPVSQAVKKVIVIKKIYIKIPVDTAAILAKRDSQIVDTIQLTLPKLNKKLDLNQFKRSRNIHRKSLITSL